MEINDWIGWRLDACRKSLETYISNISKLLRSAEIEARNNKHSDSDETIEWHPKQLIRIILLSSSWPIGSRSRVFFFFFISFVCAFLLLSPQVCWVACRICLYTKYVRRTCFRPLTLPFLSGKSVGHLFLHESRRNLSSSIAFHATAELIDLTGRSSARARACVWMIYVWQRPKEMKGNTRHTRGKNPIVSKQNALFSLRASLFGLANGLHVMVAWLTM